MDRKQEKLSMFEKVFEYIFLGLLVVYVFLFAFGGMMFGAGSAFYRSLNIFSNAGDTTPYANRQSSLFLPTLRANRQMVIYSKSIIRQSFCFNVLMLSEKLSILCYQVLHIYTSLVIPEEY